MARQQAFMAAERMSLVFGRVILVYRCSWTRKEDGKQVDVDSFETEFVDVDAYALMVTTATSSIVPTATKRGMIRDALIPFWESSDDRRDFIIGGKYKLIRVFEDGESLMPPEDVMDPNYDPFEEVTA